jgi:hypothetical protein
MLLTLSVCFEVSSTGNVLLFSRVVESDWPRPLSSSLGAGVRAVPRGHVAGRLLRNVPCLWRPLFSAAWGWFGGFSGSGLEGGGCLLLHAGSFFQLTAFTFVKLVFKLSVPVYPLA